MTMPDLKINVIDHHGKAHHVEALSGWRLMEIIRDNDLPIRSDCGGSGTCSTCHVYVDRIWQGKIPPQTTEEIHLLESSPAYDPERSRLSCQIMMVNELDCMTVSLVPQVKK